MRHLQGTGSLLTAHPLMHMEPKDAQCHSDRVVYTGTKAHLGGGEKGRNTEVIPIRSKLFRQFGIDVNVVEHCQRKGTTETKY